MARFPARSNTPSPVSNIHTTIPNSYAPPLSPPRLITKHLLSPKLPGPLPLSIQQLQLLPDPPQLIPLLLLRVFQQARMLFLEFDEFLLQLLVPRVKDEDLEAQGRGTDDEVGQGEAARDQHCVRVDRIGSVV